LKCLCTVPTLMGTKHCEAHLSKKFVLVFQQGLGQTFHNIQCAESVSPVPIIHKQIQKTFNLYNSSDVSCTMTTVKQHIHLLAFTHVYNQTCFADTCPTHLWNLSQTPVEPHWGCISDRHLLDAQNKQKKFNHRTQTFSHPPLLKYNLGVPARCGPGI